MRRSLSNVTISLCQTTPSHSVLPHHLTLSNLTNTLSNHTISLCPTTPSHSVQPHQHCPTSPTLSNLTNTRCIPYTGAEEWTSHLGFPVKTEWHPWFGDDAAGGTRVAAGCVVHLVILLRTLPMFAIIIYLFRGPAER